MDKEQRRVLRSKCSAIGTKRKKIKRKKGEEAGEMSVGGKEKEEERDKSGER